MLKDEWVGSKVNVCIVRLVARINNDCQGLMASMVTVEGRRHTQRSLGQGSEDHDVQRNHFEVPDKLYEAMNKHGESHWSVQVE